MKVALSRSLSRASVLVGVLCLAACADSEGSGFANWGTPGNTPTTSDDGGGGTSGDGGSGDGSDGGTSGSESCVPGSEGCECTPGGWCDDGLVCIEGICQVENAECGNGVVEGDEECDDGNQSNVDACLNDCKDAVCGDGHVQAGVEQCDDGNDVDDDGCTNDCLASMCGNGAIEPGEECDDGNLVDEDACTSECKHNVCGDGFIYSGVEECDDGNLDDTDECVGLCVPATCGDGFVHDGVEECDDGNADNTDACVQDCLDAACGDGFTQAGVEECDDGNLENTDACVGDCVPAACGDGYVQIGVEECDDGNQDPGDGCTPGCLLEACQEHTDLSEADRHQSFNDGDGGVESCDDSMGNQWYRFTGAAGTQMPLAPPTKFSCGTDAPGWMMGEYPSVADGAVERTACFAWTNDDCTWQTQITVLNCGTFYVFQLPDVPTCSLRYCGAG